MIKQSAALFTLIICAFTLHAQSPSLGNARDTLDAAGDPDSVTVTAFNLQTRWLSTPAAIAIISQQNLRNFGYQSLVPVLNTVSGVRMEERSPGSYRLSVRGSLLRSPFGIRNVKIYFDGIPLTDAGGNSYFNLLDYNLLQSAEIIKGPAASIYGANTGGSLLLHSPAAAAPVPGHKAQLALSGGAYGMFRQQAAYSYDDSSASFQLRQLHQQSDGFRQQSAMRKDAAQLSGKIRLNKRQQLSALAFYTDLYYQTPGGITAAQMNQDPKLARQPTASLPGAVDQHTAIFNKTAFGGLNLVSDLSDNWQNSTVVTVNHTGFQNPFITNYEQRDEWNYGGRTSFRFHQQQRLVQWNAVAGVEWMHNRSSVDNYGNRAGVKDTMQFKDRLRATQAFAFLQTDLRISRWLFQAGLSHNLMKYRYQRISDGDPQQQKELDAVLAPRISILYQLAPTVAAYLVAAKGFSPPSLAEIRPSDGNYYGNLQAEQGWNYEAGIKGHLWQNRLRFDIGIYDFRLKDAIVRRTNTAGAEFFVNAGGTVQKGLECYIQAQLTPFLSAFHSFSYQPYRFSGYKVDDTDFSGNAVTGVPRSVNVSGLDCVLPQGWKLSVLLNNTSSITLNDAATVKAKAYHLLQARVAWSCRLGKLRAEVFAAADNLLNEKYSLGNDLNAMGNRFFNPAPLRNASGGIMLDL
ncbi:TonB-dependent receptor [Filimonas effusa]|uniref:TonB-dependent receptor n=1 Tax=Filimonas effusa TaxID=2508721 RepID=A0A4Q1D9Q1_9BACT|nr:TonB-dependent receptor [Filimonas effusa]RXK85455.1 TonB-dependent receptor [Filimonas effusa]